MLPASHGINKCENFNNITRLSYPVCSRIEDKPFGSEMRYGRGICDTDPIIPELRINKSCVYEDKKSLEAATMNIDNVPLGKYSEGSLLETGQYDFGKSKEIEKQCLKYPGTYISPIGFRILKQDLRRHYFEGSKQKLNKIPSYSSKEPSECNSQITSATSSMRSAMEYKYFCEDLATTCKDTLEKGSQEKNVKPIGPFTEPPNPGKQMKLGEPYHVRNRVEKDFYKDF